MEEPGPGLRSAGTVAVPQLIDRLRDDNVLVRRTAAMVLGELGRREAEDAPIAMLDDENGHVRARRRTPSGGFASRKAAAPLLRLLVRTDTRTCSESALRALAPSATSRS